MQKNNSFLLDLNIFQIILLLLLNVGPNILFSSKQDNYIAYLNKKEKSLENADQTLNLDLEKHSLKDLKTLLKQMRLPQDVAKDETNLIAYHEKFNKNLIDKQKNINSAISNYEKENSKNISREQEQIQEEKKAKKELEKKNNFNNLQTELTNLSFDNKLDAVKGTEALISNIHSKDPNWKNNKSVLLKDLDTKRINMERSKTKILRDIKEPEKAYKQEEAKKTDKTNKLKETNQANKPKSEKNLKLKEDLTELEKNREQINKKIKELQRP